MHKDMDQLHELQEIDSGVSELQADLEALDDGSELRAQLAAAEEELGRRQATHDDDHATQSKKEAELERVDVKRKRLMDKAYGGTISNPKDLEILEQEIASLERTKDRLENELLDLFDEVDAKNQAAEEQAKVIEELRAELDQTVRTYESELARLTEQIASLRDEREQVSASVDAGSLEAYERIRGRAANLAVSVIQGRMCSACRVNLPVVQIARLTQGAALEKCESCSRLLWIES